MEMCTKHKLCAQSLTSILGSNSVLGQVAPSVWHGFLGIDCPYIFYIELKYNLKDKYKLMYF